jgi:hypothetical protein
MIRIGLVTRDRGEIPNVLIPQFQCLPKFSSGAEARGSFPGVVAVRVTADRGGNLVTEPKLSVSFRSGFRVSHETRAKYRGVFA